MNTLFAMLAFAVSLRGETFVVDPGHGTRTPSGHGLNIGAVGPSGVQEQNVVLAVGEDLAALLRHAGARVVLTRSYAQPYRIGTVKVLDNRARAALANRLGATAFVAIHADASTSRKAHGTSVFWLRPNSLAFARALRAALRTLGLGEAAYRARSLAVTRTAHVPAALVEIGFVSNARDSALLGTQAFQARVARALFAAIAGTFGVRTS